MLVKSQPVKLTREAANLRLIRQSAVAILKHGRDDGSTLVEFAMTLPPLLLVVSGILYFSLAMNNYIILRNATFIGTRAVAISRGQTTDPCSLASSAIIKAVPTMKSANLTFTYSFSGVTYTGTSCSILTSSATGNLVQGQPVSVTASYPCALTVYGHNYVPACTLSAQTTELAQ